MQLSMPAIAAKVVPWEQRPGQARSICATCALLLIRLRTWQPISLQPAAFRRHAPRELIGMHTTLKQRLHRTIWQSLPRGMRRTALFHATMLMARRPTRDARPALPIIVGGVLSTTSGLGQSARLCHDALQSAKLPVYGLDLTAALMQPADADQAAYADGHAHTGPGTVILHANAPHPVALHMPQDSPRDQASVRPVHRPFTVLTIYNTASSFARKNPWAAIEAFRKAFGSDRSARLIVKTSHLSAFPEGLRLLEDVKRSANNIIVIDKIMTAGEFAALYTEADTVMSLHRSEGFGLVLAEAMMRGLPVVATNWSGNTDFVTRETGMPIAYRLVPAVDPQGTYEHPGMSWAEADVEAAAAALQRLRADPALCHRLGTAAAEFAARNWSAEAYVGAARRHLEL